jgi:hypothetical protein
MGDQVLPYGGTSMSSKWATRFVFTCGLDSLIGRPSSSSNDLIHAILDN